MFRLLDRYILREIFWTWIGVTGVLLVILLSNKFSRFLGEIAAGSLPKEAIFSLLGYASIYYLLILIPIGLFLAVLLGLGRMYQDSEMSAMRACGVGPWQLYRPILVFAGLLCLTLFWLSMEASPWAARQTLQVRNTALAEAQLGNLEPGKFLTADSGRIVFYADAKNPEGQLTDIFLQQNNQSSSKESQAPQQLVTAERGYQKSADESGQKLFILQDGVRYFGIPGSSDYEVVHFYEHGIPFQVSVNKGAEPGPGELPSREIRTRTSLEYIAEMQWRWSIPVSAFLLALLALPLSKTNPRQGRFGKVAIAILLYIVYANLMALSKAWVVKGDISPALGMWWVHAIIVFITAIFLLRHYGLRGLFFGQPANKVAV
ncbi:MAG: LPS export ABC transporter permease LptF [Gammaproteobacteria bacterium]|nr:LPS export ABC transporter permease LptF [Gammaproteobacteria bacterium]NNC98508.1 LPS export ABC transporter permease LptF [Gammaproteobacteria bacterium]NNM13489.1 LPS export ABC transporter permease LptF [Gammaproteobacteria bacterium]